MTTKNRRAFGAFILAHRASSGLTQKQIAAKIGYKSAQFISNWERGVSFPPTHHLPKLAKLIGVSYDLLVDELFACKEMDLDAEHEAVLKRKKNA